MVSQNDHYVELLELLPFGLLIAHNCSCRLQGFPESFQIPSSNDTSTKQHRQRVSQFYRQVGNAVSPPCVAAVAKESVERLFLSPSGSVDKDCPVENLLLSSSLYPDKVMASIERKKLCQVGSVIS